MIEEDKKLLSRIAKALEASSQQEHPSGNIYCSLCSMRQPYDGPATHKDGCIVLAAIDLAKRVGE